MLVNILDEREHIKSGYSKQITTEAQHDEDPDDKLKNETESLANKHKYYTALPHRERRTLKKEIRATLH